MCIQAHIHVCFKLSVMGIVKWRGEGEGVPVCRARNTKEEILVSSAVSGCSEFCFVLFCFFPVGLSGGNKKSNLAAAWGVVVPPQNLSLACLAPETTVRARITMTGNVVGLVIRERWIGVPSHYTCKCIVDCRIY